MFPDWNRDLGMVKSEFSRDGDTSGQAFCSPIFFATGVPTTGARDGGCLRHVQRMTHLTPPSGHDDPAVWARIIPM